MLSNELLIELNKLGIIPGPGETEEEFQARSSNCLGMKKSIEDGDLDHLFNPDELAKEIPDLSALEELQNRYDIFPLWVPIFYSNKSLLPWHGASTWIFFNKDSAPQKALIQLNKTLKSSETLYKIYNKKEILTHEMAHIGRMDFEEPVYEEMIAYSHSPSKIRRFLGPMIHFNWKQSLFLFAIFILIALQLIFIETLLPLLVIVTAVSGSLFLHWMKYLRFKRCLFILAKTLKSSKKARHVIYRLTDDEIDYFSDAKPQEVLDYFELDSQEEFELRKQVIALSYFYNK